MSDDKKVVVSQILKEKRKWITTDTLPEEGKPVVVRICHKTIYSGETDTERYPLEDIKVAKYIDAKWTIVPPFPKYDYSPLTKRDVIIDGAEVTHWAELEKDELVGWVTRFDLINKYEKLEIYVDPVNEPKVYRALTWGAALINQYGDPDIKALASILYDLQHCIDFGNPDPMKKTYDESIQLQEGKVIKEE